MNLISGIANSGIFAQSAYSAGNATNDGLGRNISETYLTGIPDEYATKDYVDSGLSDKYDTSSFSAISADFLIRSGLEYENGLITGYDGSAFKDTQYSAGDNIVIDNDTISVNSSITLMHPNTLRTLNLDGNEAQFVDVSGDAGCIIDPSGLYVSNLNQTEFTIVDKDQVVVRDASGLVSIENTGSGPSIYLSRNNGNYLSTVEMYAQNHQYQKYRSYIELTDHDSATSSYNQLDLNTVDVTLTHVSDDNDPALYRRYSLTGACNSASSALNILNSSDLTYYSAGDFIDITDHVISVTDTAEAESMGIGEGLYIDASGNLCASATSNYSAGDHIDITDDTISVTGIEETDSLGLGEHLYIDASGNIDVSATETDSMGIGDNLYIDDSGNLCASGIPQSASEAIDAVTANSAQWAQSGTEYSATAPLYIDSGNIGISAKDFNLTAPLVMTEDDSAVNITVSAKDFNLTAPLVMSEDASSVNITVSSKDMEVAAPLYLTEDNSAVTLGISGILYESGFGYDSNSAISGYNGSAFAGGGGGGGDIPQSAYDAINVVTANSGEWNETYDTVSANSGAWGGSALPISAGAGMSLDIINNTLIISNTASPSPSTSGYVWESASLFHTDNPVTQTTYTLSNNCSNYDKLEVDFYDINGWRTVMDCPIPPNLATSGTRGGYFSVVPASTATGAAIWFKAFNWTAANTTWTCYCSEIAATGGSTTQTVNANQPGNPPKVVNIIGWKRVGGN